MTAKGGERRALDFAAASARVYVEFGQIQRLGLWDEALPDRNSGLDQALLDG